MIYEVEVRQTTAGRILIKANSLEEADEAANRYIQDEYNLTSIYFDDILDCDVWEVSEVSEADIVNNDTEIINAEDVL
nr:MAG TPA: PcfM DpnD/PcfM-like protein [Caudoviricetes sp.]